MIYNFYNTHLFKLLETRIENIIIKAKLQDYVYRMHLFLWIFNYLSKKIITF